jgi:hypothetical protein
MHRDAVEALRYVKFTLDRLDVMLPENSRPALTVETPPPTVDGKAN